MENPKDSIPWMTEPDKGISTKTKTPVSSVVSRKLPDPLPSGIRDPGTLARSAALKNRPAAPTVQRKVEGNPQVSSRMRDVSPLPDPVHPLKPASPSRELRLVPLPPRRQPANQVPPMMHDPSDKGPGDMGRQSAPRPSVRSASLQPQRFSGSGGTEEIPPLPRFRTRSDSAGEPASNRAMPMETDRDPRPEAQMPQPRRRPDQNPDRNQMAAPAPKVERPIHLCPDPLKAKHGGSGPRKAQANAVNRLENAGVPRRDDLQKKVIPLPVIHGNPGSEDPGILRCGACGYKNDPGSKFCGLCKQPLLSRMERGRNDFVSSLGTRNKVCVSCGKSNDYSNVFCDACGSEVVYEENALPKEKKRTGNKFGFFGALACNLASLSIGVATGVAIAKTIGGLIP